MDVEKIRADFPVLQQNRIKKEKWSKEKAIDEIKKTSKTIGNKTPTEAYYKKIKKYRIFSAAKRYFGSYTKAVICAGLKPNLNYWSKEKILLEFKKIVSDLGFVPTYRNLVRMKRHDILFAIRRHYKNKYNQVVIDSGFKPNNIRWNKENVKSEIISLYKKLGHTPTERETRAIACDLLGGAVRVFGSLNKAIQYCNLKTNKSFVENNFWKKWEAFVIHVNKKIHGIDAIKHFRLPNNKIPDVFITTEEKIIEAKLNVSSENILTTIKNYQNYSKSIEFWYLYGKPLINRCNVKFIGPHIIEKLLQDIGDKNLLRDLYLLKKGFNPEVIHLDNLGDRIV